VSDFVRGIVVGLAACIALMAICLLMVGVFYAGLELGVEFVKHAAQKG